MVVRLRHSTQRDPARLVPDFLSANLVRRTSVLEVIAADLARWNGSGSARNVRAGWITRLRAGSTRSSTNAGARCSDWSSPIRGPTFG